jgi:hypothetical protein
MLYTTTCHIYVCGISDDHTSKKVYKIMSHYIILGADNDTFKLLQNDGQGSSFIDFTVCTIPNYACTNTQITQITFSINCPQQLTHWGPGI